MRRVDRSGCLDLDHDLRVDDQIGDISAHNLAAEHYLERHFALHSMTSRAQHDGDCIRIHALEEPVSELAMHIVKRANDRS